MAHGDDSAAAIPSSQMETRSAFRQEKWFLGFSPAPLSRRAPSARTRSRGARRLFDNFIQARLTLRLKKKNSPAFPQALWMTETSS